MTSVVLCLSPYSATRRLCTDFYKKDWLKAQKMLHHGSFLHKMSIFGTCSFVFLNLTCNRTVRYHSKKLDKHNHTEAFLNHTCHCNFSCQRYSSLRARFFSLLLRPGLALTGFSLPRVLLFSPQVGLDNKITWVQCPKTSNILVCCWHYQSLFLCWIHHSKVIPHLTTPES